MKRGAKKKILKQMKRFITKILATCLAFSMLFATSSFTMDMHFCCNKLIHATAFGKAKTCDGKMQDAKKTFKKCSFNQKDCCSNKSIVKNADDSLKKSELAFDDHNIVFLQAFFYTYVNLYEGLELKDTFTDYDPPWIENDILVLHETFLI